MNTGRVQAPFGRRRVPVVARTEHGPYVVIRCEDLDGPEPRAGQFYMLAAAERWGGGAGERPFLPRAFSVLRALDAHLEFLLHDVGPGTARLCELAAGDELWILGPLGVPFAPPAAERRALLVGGGVGIAPLAILQDAELARTSSLRGSASAEPPALPLALLGFRDAHHAAGAELLRHVRLATDDGSAGHAGFVTDLLAEELHLDPHRQVYACGPPLMLEAVRMLCAEREVPAQLALESGMACGYGACFGCVVPTHDGYIRLCVDGPVLDAAKLASASFVGGFAAGKSPGRVRT